jgi:hypothetical protein
MKAQSFLFNFFLAVATPIVLILLSAIIYSYYENQVFEFCDSLEPGMNRETVLVIADEVSGAKRNQFAVGNAAEYLSAPWWAGASCAMNFENGLLSSAWKGLD